MAYDTLLVERRGPVGWLVFDRPDAGNAMDATMFRELEAAWRELDDDPAVRVIVNTGNGRAFQTGVDVVQLGRDKRALPEIHQGERGLVAGVAEFGQEVTLERLEGDLVSLGV